MIYIIHEIFIKFNSQGSKQSCDYRVSSHSEFKLHVFSFAPMCSGHCAETDQIQRQCTAASLGARQSSHISYRCSRISDYGSDYETAAPQGRRTGSRWPGPFAPLRTSHVLCLCSFSLSLSSLTLRGFLVSRVKFTNPYGAPRASNESLFLSSTVFLVLHLFLLFALFVFYISFISYFGFNFLPSICF